jgi:hypothetical protein
MKKTKKSKKAKVVVKDLELSKVKGGVEEEDPKGGIIDDNRLMHKDQRGQTLPSALKIGGGGYRSVR